MSEQSRVFSATLLFFVGFYMLLVPLPPYLVDLGLADWQVGLVLGSFGMAALVGRPLAGLASDRLGRRTVMIAGVLIFAAGVVAILLTTACGAAHGARASCRRWAMWRCRRRRRRASPTWPRRDGRARRLPALASPPTWP